MNPEMITAIAGILACLCIFLLWVIFLLWKYPDAFREECNKHKVTQTKLDCLQRYVSENKHELEKIKRRRKAEKSIHADQIKGIRPEDMAIIEDAIYIAVHNMIVDNVEYDDK